MFLREMTYGETYMSYVCAFLLGQVSLTSGEHHFCGGRLIQEGLVVTAAWLTSMSKLWISIIIIRLSNLDC